jgi:hypothetical protein
VQLAVRSVDGTVCAMSPTHAVTVRLAEASEPFVVATASGDVARRTAARLAQLPGEFGVVGASSVPLDELDGSGDESSVAFGHVFAQQAWHDSVRISVDRAGAAAVATAALNALVDGSGAAQLFCVDGEGYDLVIDVSDPDADDGWELPYVDPIAGGPDTVVSDPQLAALIDAFDAVTPDERAVLPDALVAALSSLRTRCRGPLLAPDDPRAA